MTTIGMSAAQKLVNVASGGSLGSYPNFGMSMRFAVTVDSLQSLGLWQSCKNLQVEMKYKPIEQGGQYTQITQLPDRISWPQITLERAVEQKASLQVWTWLNSYIQACKGNGEFPRFSTVSIILLDYQLNGVLEWTLENVRPVRWVGPALSATENKVAIEQLVLDHQGFECSRPAKTR